MQPDTESLNHVVQVGALFTFLARQMARPENEIVVEKRMFEQVLDYLSNPTDTTQTEERQQARLIIHWIHTVNLHAGAVGAAQRGRADGV